jgi:nanoRNase/pAp phosphatase (c-di-AMP/oligoRNAs hydrolase)
MSLGRGASERDTAAYFYLQPRIDVNALVQIERAQVLPEYFKSFVKALQSTRTYDGIVVTDIGILSYPGLAAEIADQLMRLELAQWVICYGLYKDRMILAVRTRDHKRSAENLAKAIVGEIGSAGGHGTYAGGQIQLHGGESKEYSEKLIQRALQLLVGSAEVKFNRLLD